MGKVQVAKPCQSAHFSTCISIGLLKLLTPQKKTYIQCPYFKAGPKPSVSNFGPGQSQQKGKTKMAEESGSLKGGEPPKKKSKKKSVPKKAAKKKAAKKK
jgi:hypothetical protein